MRGRIGFCIGLGLSETFEGSHSRFKLCPHLPISRAHKEIGHA